MKRNVNIKDRKGYIGGSDAGRIINGDWLALWQEKAVDLIAQAGF